MSSKYKNTVFAYEIVPEPYFSTINDIFGMRAWRKKKYPNTSGWHLGIDIDTPMDTLVFTPYDGKVSQIESNVYACGNVLKIEIEPGFELRYLHLNSFLVQSKGQQVKAGQPIATTGNTDGSSSRSTGPHLHFEVIINGKQVDPAPYLFGYALKDKLVDSKSKFAPDLNVTFKSIANVDYTDLLRETGLNSEQLAYARIIVNTTKQLIGTKRDCIIAIMTAMQESNLRNLTGGAGDSRGLFQQSPSNGWGTVSQVVDPEFATKSFLKGRKTNKGLLSFKNRESVSLGDCCQLVQRSAYPNAYAKWETNATKVVNVLYGVVIDSFLNEQGIEILDNYTEEVNVDDYLAPGIWQIVKLVIDPEVAERQINDATIAFMQGSLYSFFEKVCQKPFVEFWGDTYGDQFYFVVRKPPFTRQSFLSLTTIKVYERNVYSDSLVWENDNIYSWYMLEPNGNYIGGSSMTFQYLQSVFFAEYAEIWGSRPYSVTCNYITFIKETYKVQLEAAEADLKFMVDCNSYMPFTRKGTITIKGDRRIKKGMRILYTPTDEYYYVDAVANNFSSTDGIIERTTVLTVSRGMKRFEADMKIIDETTPSYFNLINYGPGQYSGAPKKDDNVAKSDDNIKVDRHVAYFNQDKHTFEFDDIQKDNNLEQDDSGALFLGAGSDSTKTEELKITKKILDNNFKACDKIVEQLYTYPGLNLVFVGNTDEVASNEYNIALGKRRSTTVRNIVIQKYTEKYKLIQSEIESLESRLTIETKGEEQPASDNKTPLGRLKNRRVDVYVEGELEKYKNKVQDPAQNQITPAPSGNKWHVNRSVFMYLLRKEQFNPGMTI